MMLHGVARRSAAGDTCSLDISMLSPQGDEPNLTKGRTMIDFWKAIDTFDPQTADYAKGDRRIR